MIGRPKFVLASGSPRRLALINQAGIEPDALKPADLDETPRRSEIPRAYATRLAQAKATAALENVNLDDELRGAFILAADTVVAVGRRILPKAELLDEAAQCLRLLSGRNHRVYTAICLVTPKENFRQRLVETRVNGAARPAATQRRVSPALSSSRLSAHTATSLVCRFMKSWRFWAARAIRFVSAG